jgi:hypothetical protein
MKFKFNVHREPAPLLIGLLMIGLVLSGVVITGLFDEPEESTAAIDPALQAESVTPENSQDGDTVTPESMTPTVYLPSLVVAPTSTPVTPPTDVPTTSELASVNVNIVGPEEIVFDWSEDACEQANYPDAPARAFRDADGRVQLILSHYTNYRMIGPDLNHLTIDCNAIMFSDYDPDPAKFNGREWIHALYSPDGNSVYALIHNEYQGNRHPGQCPSGQYLDCWYNAITLAVSTNSGVTYTHAEPPSHLVAGLPYVYEPGGGPFGIFNPSNILLNPADNYYYVLLHVEDYQGQSRGTCLMRTQNLAEPSSWRAWNGKEFSVRFINVYQDRNAAVQDHICQPVSFPQIQKMWESITFNTYLNRFLLIGTASTYDVATGRTIWGIYYSLSTDLLHWSPRALLLETERTWSYECGDTNPIASPAVLDPESLSRNFDTTGQRAYLYFTRLNYESCVMTSDRDLIRVPVEFYLE